MGSRKALKRSGEETLEECMEYSPCLLAPDGRKTAIVSDVYVTDPILSVTASCQMSVGYFLRYLIYVDHRIT